jgi:hypothetical protein
LRKDLKTHVACIDRETTDFAERQYSGGPGTVNGSGIIQILFQTGLFAFADIPKLGVDEWTDYKRKLWLPK